MTVTYSVFQDVGQTKDVATLLKISVSGMAKRSANLVTKEGKISPDTIDFGLRNFFSLVATW